MTGLLIVVGLMALALIAPRYGMDLRDSSDWRWQTGRNVPVRGARHTPRSDLAALNRWMARVGRILARRWEAQERAWGAAWTAYQPWRGDDVPNQLHDLPAQIYARARADRARAARLEAKRLEAESAADPGELRWRLCEGFWALEGRLLPSAPPAGDPSNERPVHQD
ncbi:MAG: hypothetical protein QOG76_2972 [Pseudonocardiales bacterium]|nr:hypothetical protein [Pseudonocardiales bacterium]